MRKVTFLLFFLVVGLGLFVAAALNVDRLDPLLVRFGVEPYGWIIDEGIKALGIILVGAPLAALLWTVAGLGSDTATTDIHGDTVLRLKSGGRFGFALLAVALAGASFFAAATDEEATLAFRLLVPLFGLFFVHLAFLLIAAKVRFNTTTICATAFSGRTVCHQWADLKEVKTNRESKEFTFVFQSGRKAKISFYYQDVGKVLDMAYGKLERNAGITRG